jgi:hypothetical protein
VLTDDRNRSLAVVGGRATHRARSRRCPDRDRGWSDRLTEEPEPSNLHDVTAG